MIRDAAAAARALRLLDRVRGEAFARREPELLRRVYASPALYVHDRALLLAVVPAPCGLAGVHTDYRGVRLLPARRGLVAVAARASVQPSRLMCGGVAVGTAPGTPTAALDVELVRGPGGYRISSIRRQGPS